MDGWWSFVRMLVELEESDCLWMASSLTLSSSSAQNGFAVVRPPGHHADPANPM